MPKRKCLKLFTKTWPPKDKENDDEPTRPLTATLEKPMILDISFIDKIDMTLMRKEFFSLTNLCRLPITISLEKIAGKQQDGTRRPLSLPSSEKFLGKRSKNLDSSEEDNSLSSVRSKLVKAKTVPRRYPITHSLSDTNNNTKAYKLPKKLPPTTPVAPSPPKSNKLPQPCKTCGRFDQPERLHSHPVTQPRCSRKMEEKIPVKNSVQKPVAIRYKPRNQLSPQKLPTAKKSLPQETKQVTKSEVNRVKSAKRTLTCYLCGREFGTASLHLHEPKCLEKWQRENNKLPPHLRRKPPPKPDHHLSQEEWNKFAWDASQMTLVPCENCGRTFLPDRLVVHQRSCKAPSKMCGEVL